MENKKSPLLSSILSLIIPGLGQVHAGAPARGAVFFTAIAIMAPLIHWRESYFLYAGVAIVWLWNVWLR